MSFSLQLLVYGVIQEQFPYPECRSSARQCCMYATFVLPVNPLQPVSWDKHLQEVQTQQAGLLHYLILKKTVSYPCTTAQTCCKKHTHTQKHTNEDFNENTTQCTTESGQQRTLTTDHQVFKGYVSMQDSCSALTCLFLSCILHPNGAIFMIF